MQVVAVVPQFAKDRELLVICGRIDTRHKRSARVGRLKKLVIHLPDAMGNMPGCRLTDNYWYALNTLGPLEITNMMTMSSNAEILKELRTSIT